MNKVDIQSQLAGLTPLRRRALEVLLQRQASRERIAKSLYAMTWRPSQPAARAAGRSRDAWLVLADATGVGKALAQRLEAQGARCRVVYGVASAAGEAVDARDAKAVASVVESWLSEKAERRHIAYLWSLDTTAAKDTTADSLMRDQEHICGGALNVVHALAKGGGPEARLWIMTRGAQRLPGDTSSMAVAQSTLLGFGRCLALEHPELWGGLVDFDPDSDIPEALVDQLLGNDAELEVAWRKGMRYVPRVTAAELPLDEIPVPRLSAEATYLITGGTSELALYLARWMVGQGARHIALASRGVGTAETDAAVQALEQRGAKIARLRGDVAIAADVRRIVSDIQTTMPPLRGIVHAAAVVDYAMLRQQTWARFAPVVAPKVAGAWNLHAETRHLPLDFFAMYSSLSALGYEASSNYAAANAFMDAFAQARRSEGLPATSINWTAWAQIGGIKRLTRSDQDRLASSGVGFVEPDDGMHVMGMVISGGARVPAQVVVHPIADAEKLRWHLRAKGDQPLFSELGNVTSSNSAADERPLLMRLREGSRLESEALVEDQLRASASAVLGIDNDAAIDSRRALVDLGMTSLLANDFRLRVAADMGFPRGTLPATLAFNYPTIEALKNHILDDIVPKLEVPTEAPRAAPAYVEAPVKAPVAKPQRTAVADSIAIIGMSCRFPAGADTPEQLWRVLADGVDPVRTVPKDRWDADAVYDADPDAPGRSHTRAASFVSDWDMFDPAFFGMSPREASATDPQQRLLLELTWTALADAGYAPEDVFGAKVGVYAAVYGTDYISQLARAGLEAIDVYTAAGIAHGVAAGRLSYALGVHGPSMTIDAACSSSLVAMHLAAESLRRGECDIAVVAAASAMLGPNGHILLTKTRMVSTDGRSRAFDAAANGYGRSEGGCVVVLKRADDAVNAGDTVHALVRGSSINQDGRSASLVAPNGPAQVAVIRGALRDAGVSDEDIDYVECAGTGSSMGDAIEYSALAEVFGRSIMRTRPVVVGSVKTNIGHTESVSGLAGVLKIVLAMRHEALPPHLHLRELNPELRPANGELIVGSELRPWPRRERKRLASVQSYGMSGTNAHVVLEEPPAAPEPTSDIGPFVLRLSARSEAGLMRLAKSYAGYLRNFPARPVSAVCATAERGRSPQEHRLAIVARDRRSLVEALSDGRTVHGGAAVLRGTRAARGNAKVGMLFSASSNLPAASVRELLASSVRFRDVVERCAAAVRGRLNGSLLDALSRAPDVAASADERALAMVAAYAVQCGLWEVWNAAGVTPLAVCGQSLGELAAAYAVGVSTLEDGAALVAEIARRVTTGADDVAWFVVDESAERVKAILGVAQAVSVVASNAPKHTIIGGRTEAVREIVQRLTSQNITTHELRSSSALHTRSIDITEQDVERWCGALTFGEPRAPIVSSVTGRVVAASDLASPKYWARLLRSPVQFKDAVKNLTKLGADALVDFGGDGLLTHAASVLGDSDVALLPAVDVLAEADIQVEAALAKAFTVGVAVAVDGLRSSGNKVVTRVPDAPAYAFERQRCWLPASVAGAAPVAVSREHPLLGTRKDSDDGVVYQSSHSSERLSFLRDHGNYGTPIFPGMAFIEMALAAGADAFPHQQLRLVDVSFERALVLAPEPADVELSLTTIDEARSSYVVRSRPQGASAWLTHTSGVLHHGGDNASEAIPESLSSLRERLTKAVSADELYERMQSQGQDYGAAFRGMTAVWRAPDTVGEALGRIELPTHVRAEIAAYRAHPALLDACGHPTYIAVNGDATTAGSFMFAGADTVRVHRGAGVAVWSHVVARSVADTATRAVFSADIHVYDDDGRVVAELLGVRNVAVEAGTMSKLAQAPVAEVTSAPHAPVALSLVSADADSVRDLVMREVGAALGMAPEQRVGARQVLKDLGLDSLVAVQLRNRLQTATGASLPVTLLFEYPTVQALTDFLVPRIAGASARATPASSAVRVAAVPAVAVTPMRSPAAASTAKPSKAGVTSRLSSILAAIEQLDDGELDVLAGEILGDGR